MWHSCSQHTLDERFARSTPDARAAFERFVQLVERCGPVVVIAQKTRIVLLDRVRFAGATVLRDRVRLNFALTRQLDEPWVESTETYMAGRWNAHRFTTRTPADVDAIPNLPALLCESYRELGSQAALRRQVEGRRSGSRRDMPTR